METDNAAGTEVSTKAGTGGGTKANTTAGIEPVLKQENVANISPITSSVRSIIFHKLLSQNN